MSTMNQAMARAATAHLCDAVFEAQYWSTSLEDWERGCFAGGWESEFCASMLDVARDAQIKAFDDGKFWLTGQA